MKALSRITLALVGSAMIAGCSQPEMIDRTQPNYIKKSDLDGVWYIKETIVDAPETPNGVATVGYGGKLEKIRWEIQEDMLVAVRSYEVVPGADPRVDREKSARGNVMFHDGKPYKGNVVFAYRIQSHFDRVRDYNRATGTASEETNVLVENSVDAPWYQRGYMRVDFRQNLANNADSDCTNMFGYSFGCVGGNRLLVVNFTTDQDQNQYDLAQVFERDANGRLNYFDWTAQAIADPRSLYYPGYGAIPYCWLNSEYDCENVDIRVRTSVLRVDQQANDYEPLVYNDKLMVKFGYFRQEAASYSIDFGYTYSGMQFFAMRHNIWERAHDEQGAVIPVTQRALKPIVYYMSENTPAELRPSIAQNVAQAQGFDPRETIEASWDRAFRRSVAVPRGLEVADVPQMFYVCESPVPEGAPAACGKAGTFVRPGDIRYHLANYVDQNAGGLLGLGPSAMDPETGRVVSAAANVYGPVLDAWAGGSQQVIDVVNGDITPARLVAGEDIRDYVKANFHPTDPRRPASGPWQSQQGLSSDAARPASTMMGVNGLLKGIVQQWRDQGRPPVSSGNRRELIQEMIKKSPQLEEELYNLPELRTAVAARSTNWDFQQRIKQDPQLYRAVARGMLFGDDPVEKERAWRRNLVDSNVGCFYEYSYADEDYEGLAKRKKTYELQRIDLHKAAGKSDEDALRLAKSDVYNSLRREAYRSVQEHEIGHTLGLRHNFTGSVDAINFHDGYWDLRKETIGVRVAGERVLPVTPQNLLDASKKNQRQIDEGMYEYEYSTIMDYGARPNSSTRGTGKYDDAAILFAYAGGSEPGWVEVFNELRTDYAQPNITLPLDNQARVFTARGAHVEIPLAHVEHYTPASTFYSDKYHYTTLPFHFADQGGGAPADASDNRSPFERMLDQGISRMNNRSFRPWSEMKAHYERVAAELKDFQLSVGSLDQESGYDSDYDRARIIVTNSGGREIPVEVPYMFCSDGEVGANLLCNRHDQGVDVYEMTTKWIERFEQAYVFENFRRDRFGYGINNVVGRKFGRYLYNIPNVYQQWLYTIYFLAKYYQLTPEEMDQYYGLGDPIYQNYWTMAVVDSTNLMMQQFSIPQAGYYGQKTDSTWEYVSSGDPQNRRLSDAAENAFRQTQNNAGYTEIVYVPRGPGRSMFTVYDSFGYDNFTRINESGHFWDVLSAMLALTTNETNFLGVDRGADALAYSLPYYRVFYRELAPMFNAYWTSDTTYYSPMLARQNDGTAFIQLPTFVRAENFVPGFVYPPAAVTPVDNTGTPMALNKAAPVQTWTSRYYAQLLAMASFTANLNSEFAELNRVYRLGSSDNLVPAPGFESVEFADPFGGGFTYAAFKKTGVTPVPASAVMVERAAAASNNWFFARDNDTTVDGKTAAQWEAETRDATRTLEIMRGMYSVFGSDWR